MCAITFASGVSNAALVPPAEFVRHTDGVTKLSLEAAGILNPDGRQYALALGKALFWDMQTGSDGNACASCHFHAGADTRLRNQLTPGFKDLTAPGGNGDTTFGSQRSDTGQVLPGYMPSGALADSNYFLNAADFPLHQLDDETNRNSPVRTTTNDRVSSQGSFDQKFKIVPTNGTNDTCTELDGSVFHAGAYAARRVEPRNTPTTVNAAFFHRNFWDGRANNLFNGSGVFGMRDILGGPAKPADPRNQLIVLNSSGQPELGHLEVENASLASQAVGPPLSELEMSCEGRKFADVGRKLLFTKPLRTQAVLKTDSGLGSYASPTGKGLALKHSYASLIMKAFNRKYWGASGRFLVSDAGVLRKDLGGYTQMEWNFSMFWGIAIMLYEQTLVSDRSELDVLTAGGPNASLKVEPQFPGPTPGGCSSPNGSLNGTLLLRGCTIFMRFNPLLPGVVPADGLKGGNCFVCHNGIGGGLNGGNPPPLLSQAAFTAGQAFAPIIRVGSQVPSGQPPPNNFVNHTHDQGFMSVGLRPVFTDVISGGTDPYGNPLSFSRQYWKSKRNGIPVSDPLLQSAMDASDAELAANVAGCPPPTPPGTVCSIKLGFPVTNSNDPGLVLLGVDGASKSPILRNVALTPPYFSWGGYPSLRQALKLYNRGFNRRDIAPNPAVERAAGTGCVSGDNSGTGTDGNKTLAELETESNCASNTTGTILPLGLVDCDVPGACTSNGLTPATDDLAALETFMKAMTDRRVQCDEAPFDHPSLKILNGHKTTDANGDGKADDITFNLPAVGAAGYPRGVKSFCIPNAGDLFAPGMQSRSGGAKVIVP